VFKIIFLFFIFFVILSLYTQGCSNLQEKEYTKIPDEVYNQAKKVCDNIDGSHFIVKDFRVWLKQKNGMEIELKHYNALLPDGYYFCSQNVRDSLIIE
tara:strand:+ start:804 stop:1097 length:294 start_codon:yes stop_codon:yes gene_type:complete